MYSVVSVQLRTIRCFNNCALCTLAVLVRSVVVMNEGEKSRKITIPLLLPRDIEALIDNNPNMTEHVNIQTSCLRKQAVTGIPIFITSS